MNELTNGRQSMGGGVDATTLQTMMQAIKTRKTHNIVSNCANDDLETTPTPLENEYE